MGLAGVKNRRKLGKDPNNTRWSRNEDTFGQKILRNQGWQPGQFLGVQGSAHSAHHTAANASHIRVAFRDSNAGIGMKMGAEDQPTGMGAFQDLLGRLNGKSEEKIQLERKVREDYKANLYMERKYGGMRFVKGGLLVGDKIKSLDDRIEEAEPSEREKQTCTVPEPQSEQATHKKSKKEKKEKKSKRRKATDDVPETETDSLKTKRRKKNESRKSDDDMADAPATEPTSSTDSLAGEVTKKKKSKRSKGEKDVNKVRRRKDKKEKCLSSNDYNESISDRKEEKNMRKDKGSKESEEAEEPPTQPSPTTSREASTSGTSTPRHQPIGARRLHRSKFIASKRAAVMDQVALNQIFMIKSAAGA